MDVVVGVEAGSAEVADDHDGVDADAEEDHHGHRHQGRGGQQDGRLVDTGSGVQ